MPTRPPGSPVVAVNGVSYGEFIRRKRQNPKMKNVSWQGYAAYVANKASQKAALRAGTAAQIYGQNNFQVNPAYVAKMVGRYLPQQPQYAPLTNQQLQQQARSMIMPMYTSQADEITKMIQDRSQRGMQAIQGYTNSYLSTLPQVQADTAHIYDEARALQGASSGALADFIRNQGSSMTNELAQAEQAAGQTSAGSQQVAQTAAGSSGATAGYDWSTMARLIGQGAGAQAYAAQLPAIGGAYSAQTVRDFQSQLNDQLQSSMSALQQQGQGDILDMYNTLLNRELQKAQGRDTRAEAMASAFTNQLGANQSAKLAGATLMAGLQGQGINNAADYISGINSAANTAATATPQPTKVQKIMQAWQQISPNISNAISGLINGTKQPGQIGGTPGVRDFNVLMSRLIPMIRSQMGEFGLTDGQVRGFARQILAMHGIYPPASAQAVAANPPVHDPGQEPRDFPGQVNAQAPVKVNQPPWYTPFLFPPIKFFG